MKRLLLILASLFLAWGLVFGTQPVRKPYIEINVNGEKFKDGDILDVASGQLVKIDLTFEGGRRDFTKFPEKYADISSSAIIQSQTENYLKYNDNAVNYEWKLLNQDFLVDADSKIKFRSQKVHPNLQLLWVNAPSRKVENPYIKISVKSSWQYTEEELVMLEEDEAEAIIHLNIIGKSEAWYESRNIKATGNESPRLEEKLDEIQQCYYAIENNIVKRDFKSTQIEIRKLQSTFQQTELLINQLKNEDKTFFADIALVGLPSDKPIKDIERLSEMSNFWSELNPMIELHQANFSKLSMDSESSGELLKITSAFNYWYTTLPKEATNLLSTYFQYDWNDKADVSNYISFKPNDNSLKYYERSYLEVRDFLEQRAIDIPYEIQVINCTIAKLKPARLFHGMLRGLLSSASFASWEPEKNENLYSLSNE